MLKILHTSDWHLGKRLERFSRHEEQVAVIEEIIQVADENQVDLVLIAGDLFDTFNPPAESLDLFYRSLKRLAKNGKRPVIAIAGNHDMPERIEAPDPLARECGIIFAGFPESVVTPFAIEDNFSITKSEAGFLELQLPGKPAFRLLLTPYANEMRLRKGLNPENPEEELREILSGHWKNLADTYCDDQGVNALMAHLLFMPESGIAPEEPEDERPINHIGGAQAIYTSSIPPAIQYVALGHLHRKQAISLTPCPVMYSGSPLSYSFSEAGQDKQVLIVELEPGKDVKISPVPLKSGRKLERKRFLTMADAEAWLLAALHSLVELTIVSGTFLSGADRRRLMEIHDGIVVIIPEITGPDTKEEENTSGTPQQKSMQELFADFFKSKKGQEPDPAILSLFQEINAEEEEV
ncbi:MAG: exonuclease subunit SbcD [Bacteroidetes bacterium]|nr:exonuclease subunit SbcD [Bacteroidota bacterium]